MDFVTLATETDPRRMLRFLDEMLGNSGDDGSGSGGGSGGGGGDMPPAAGAAAAARPLLSRASEAELYLLATNFLLYVAMVIITTIVAKVYFPESLERTAAVSTPRARSYGYRMAQRSQGDGDGNGDEDDDDEEYYGSDAEDEEDDDDGEGEEDDEDEVLDSDDEADPLRPQQPRDGDGEQQQSSPAARRRRHRAHDKAKQQSHRSSGTAFLEFSQASLTRMQVVRRLVFCSVMLNLVFVLWGALQERMLTRRYPRYTGEYFTYSYALVFTNRFWTLIMSGMLMMYFRPRGSQTTVIYEYSFPSISNLLSSWCQYEALRYVSFPATTLFKSFKLAPVMLMGKLLGNKSYPQYDYFVALMIGVGIAMFMTSTDDLRFGYDYLGEEVYSATWTGVMLLFFYLFFDSFTSQFQSRMFQHHRDLSMVELMFATSCYSTVLSFITLVHTKELYPAMEFVVKHSEIHLHFFLFSICSTIGQLFIFYTIRNFGAVVFTLIMTTRILISIALSCVLYGHQVSATGFFGLVLVLGAVIYRIRRKAQGQQLIKWVGMEDDAKKEFELVQEWHEHVDM